MSLAFCAITLPALRNHLPMSDPPAISGLFFDDLHSTSGQETQEMARKKMTAAQKDRRRRMRWWHQAKFGMFVHWGLYSVLGRHEWAMECEGIPVAEYERLVFQVVTCRICKSSILNGYTIHFFLFGA